jgi:putative transposase
MSHTYTNLLTHVIFSTKDRRPDLGPDLRPSVFAYVGGIVRELGGTALAINGRDDHLHALIVLPASVSLADAMRVVKTNSSRWIHEKWPQRKAFAWQTGYRAFSVSRSNVDDVVRYIENQEEHRRTVSFQDEFLVFLQRHGVAYDPRYVWN